MKTTNYQFDLMYQGQEHKDIVYNESILKLDANLNLSVDNFVERPLESINYGQRFILTSGENKNKICYFAHSTKGLQYISPYNNMLVYIVKDGYFAIFSDNSWQKVSAGFEDQVSSSSLKFIGINDEYLLPSKVDCYYLYLEAKCALSFEQVTAKSFTVIIKQNYEKVFNVKWPENILWPEKEPIQVTSTVNAIDFFRFQKIAESKHFLAETIKKNYQY